MLRWRDGVDVDPKEMGWWACYWIDLAQDRGKRWALVRDKGTGAPYNRPRRPRG